jgi:hypothetical protein
MNTPFNLGNPVYFDVIAVSDSVITLDPNGHSFATVQFQDPQRLYTDTNNTVALYNKQGIDPNQDPENPHNAFIGGLNDIIVFSNNELVAGVKILNYTNGSTINVVVQYYRNA